MGMENLAATAFALSSEREAIAAISARSQLQHCGKHAALRDGSGAENAPFDFFGHKSLRLSISKSLSVPVAATVNSRAVRLRRRTLHGNKLPRSLPERLIDRVKRPGHCFFLLAAKVVTLILFHPRPPVLIHGSILAQIGSRRMTRATLYRRTAVYWKRASLVAKTKGRTPVSGLRIVKWLRGSNSNRRPSGYEHVPKQVAR